MRFSAIRYANCPAAIIYDSDEEEENFSFCYNFVFFLLLLRLSIDTIASHQSLSNETTVCQRQQTHIKKEHPKKTQS